MTTSIISFHSPYLANPRKKHIAIEVIISDKFGSWLKKQPPELQAAIENRGFAGKSGQIHVTMDEHGEIHSVYAGSDTVPTFENGSKIHDAIKSAFSKSILDKTSFTITGNIRHDSLERLQIGWAFAAYSFTRYKKADKNEKKLALVLNESSDIARIKAFIESVFLVRDLVNIPANDLGPDELQAVAEILTGKHKIKLKTIKDKELIKKNFPMIYEVGKGSSRRPRLLDFSWGNKKHPKITLVGKGVCFDTGGYDIKPSQYMYNMKKDMGGAAHVLALAHMIIKLKLPVCLRVLIPAVENSVSAEAYRPADVLQTRKGITVEVGNTDAEGRLVLADALTYACEEKPDLLIDYATLTGSARVALGPDLPALFSNTEKTAQSIQALSQKDNVSDPVWNLPLWQGYRVDIDSDIADIKSTGGKAGATIAALFLNEFVEEGIEWLHLDTYAWEDNGRSGRPKGGADAGLRSIFAFLEERYAK